jgi:protease I
MENTLKKKKIAIVATNGFEEVELTKPREALEKAGAETYLVSPEEGKIKAWDHTDWGVNMK